MRTRRPLYFRPAATIAMVLPILAFPPGAAAQTPTIYATPEISQIEEFKRPNAIVYAMRGELGRSNTFVGMAFTCATRGPRNVQANAFFGSFPADRRPVQLAVRLPDGTGRAYGPAVRGGPESGFHSPLIRDPSRAEAFANAALRSGSLISNGYRSFRNRASKARNRQVREAFVTCLRR